MNGGKWGGRKTSKRATMEKEEQALRREDKTLKTEPDFKEECYFHSETLGCRLVECSCDRRQLAQKETGR